MSMLLLSPATRRFGYAGTDLNRWLVLLVAAERIGVAYRHLRIRGRKRLDCRGAGARIGCNPQHDADPRLLAGEQLMALVSSFKIRT